MRKHLILGSAGLLTLALHAPDAGAQPVAILVGEDDGLLSTTATETFPGSNAWDFEVVAPGGSGKMPA